MPKFSVPKSAYSQALHAHHQGSDQRFSPLTPRPRQGPSPTSSQHGLGAPPVGASTADRYKWLMQALRQRLDTLHGRGTNVTKASSELASVSENIAKSLMLPHVATRLNALFDELLQDASEFGASTGDGADLLRYVEHVFECTQSAQLSVEKERIGTGDESGARMDRFTGHFVASRTFAPRIKREPIEEDELRSDDGQPSHSPAPIQAETPAYVPRKPTGKKRPIQSVSSAAISPGRSLVNVSGAIGVDTMEAGSLPRTMHTRVPLAVLQDRASQATPSNQLPGAAMPASAPPTERVSRSPEQNWPAIQLVRLSMLPHSALLREGARPPLQSFASMPPPRVSRPLHETPIGAGCRPLPQSSASMPTLRLASSPNFASPSALSQPSAQHFTPVPPHSATPRAAASAPLPGTARANCFRAPTTAIDWPSSSLWNGHVSAAYHAVKSMESTEPVSAALRFFGILAAYVGHEQRGRTFSIETEELKYAITPKTGQRTIREIALAELAPLLSTPASLPRRSAKLIFETPLGSFGIDPIPLQNAGPQTRLRMEAAVIVLSATWQRQQAQRNNAGLARWARSLQEAANPQREMSMAEYYGELLSFAQQEGFMVDEFLSHPSSLGEQSFEEKCRLQAMFLFQDLRATFLQTTGRPVWIAKNQLDPVFHRDYFNEDHFVARMEERGLLGSHVPYREFRAILCLLRDDYTLCLT